MYIKSPLKAFFFIVGMILIPMFEARVIDFFYLSLIFLWWVNPKIKRRVKKINMLLLSAFLLWPILLAFLNTVFHTPIMGAEYYFTYYFLRFIVLYLFFFKVFRIDQKAFSSALFVFALIGAATVILDILNIPMWEEIFKLFRMRSMENTLVYRATGFYSGYYTATIMTSVFLAYFLLHEEYKKFLILCIPSLIAVFFSGRSGFVVFMLLAFCIVLIGLKNFLSRPKLDKRSIKYISLMSISIILLCFIVFPWLLKQNKEMTTLVLQIPKIMTGNVEGSSMRRLQYEMYYWPEDNWTLFVGTNLKPFPNGSRSDSGYIQILYGAGLIGWLVYLFFLLFVLRMVRIDKYLFFLLLVLFVLSYKGELFYGATFQDYLFLVLTQNKRKGILKREYEKTTYFGG